LFTLAADNVPVTTASGCTVNVPVVAIAGTPDTRLLTVYPAGIVRLLLDATAWLTANVRLTLINAVSDRDCDPIVAPVRLPIE
jgi:hypothetical protein